MARTSARIFPPAAQQLILSEEGDGPELLIGVDGVAGLKAGGHGPALDEGVDTGAGVLLAQDHLSGAEAELHGGHMLGDAVKKAAQPPAQSGALGLDHGRNVQKISSSAPVPVRWIQFDYNKRTSAEKGHRSSFLPLCGWGALEYKQEGGRRFCVCRLSGCALWSCSEIAGGAEPVPLLRRVDVGQGCVGDGGTGQGDHLSAHALEKPGDPALALFQLGQQ